MVEILDTTLREGEQTPCKKDLGLWTLGLRLRDIFFIAQKREQGEERAQHIFAFGNPRDGFHMQRMPGKQRGDKRGRPQRARQAPEQRQQQNHVGGVKQDVDDVMCAGVETEQFAIQHVRQPGQRMPIAGVAAAERPPQSWTG